MDESEILTSCRFGLVLQCCRVALQTCFTRANSPDKRNQGWCTLQKHSCPTPEPSPDQLLICHLPSQGSAGSAENAHSRASSALTVYAATTRAFHEFTATGERVLPL